MTNSDPMKCDGFKPACHRCTRRGENCPGFPEAFRFLEHQSQNDQTPISIAPATCQTKAEDLAPPQNPKVSCILDQKPLEHTPEPQLSLYGATENPPIWPDIKCSQGPPWTFEASYSSPNDGLPKTETVSLCPSGLNSFPQSASTSRINQSNPASNHTKCTISNQHPTDTHGHWTPSTLESIAPWPCTFPFLSELDTWTSFAPSYPENGRIPSIEQGEISSDINIFERGTTAAAVPGLLGDSKVNEHHEYFDNGPTVEISDPQPEFFVLHWFHLRLSYIWALFSPED